MVHLCWLLLRLLLVQAECTPVIKKTTPHLQAASPERIVELLVGIFYTKLGISLPLSAA